MNFRNYDLLEIIEEFAASNNLIDSETKLSEMFDEQMAQFVIDQYGEDDTVAINEAFNDWSDSLCRDGDLHEVQYQNYCYIGKYAGE